MAHKKSMKFPLITKGAMVYPETGKCPVCGKDLLGNFVILCGGALLYVDKNKTIAQLSDNLLGFFHLVSHRKEDDGSYYLDLAEHSGSGQFEFYFCSTKCMRKFLNKCVDELEKKAKPEKRRAK